MEEVKNYDAAAAKDAIVKKFLEQGDFLIFGEDAIGEMTQKIMALDDEFIKNTDADGDGFYDDDAAFTFMVEKMQEAFPERKMYMMRFTEDYMDFNEEYLDEAGLIDWE